MFWGYSSNSDQNHQKTNKPLYTLNSISDTVECGLGVFFERESYKQASAFSAYGYF